MNPRIIAAAAGVVLAFSSGALAQFDTTDSSFIGVGIAVFRPSSDELKNLSSNWLGATLQFHVNRDELDRPSTLVSIGWFAADKAAARANFVPLGFTMIKRFGTEESSWYVGGGLDLYFAHFESYDFDPATFSYRLVSDNGAKFGYNLALGREWGGGWYFEAKRDSVAKLSHQTGGSIDFSGWTIIVGSRLAY